jgi:hypothetical protein
VQEARYCHLVTKTQNHFHTSSDSDLESSLVNIPANAESSILNVKDFRSNLVCLLRIAIVLRVSLIVEIRNDVF